MKILITGSAGFIGFHLSKKLLSLKYSVVGIDNLNNYYDPSLKLLRLDKLSKEPNYENFTFLKGDLSDEEFIDLVFKENKFDAVVNLAAQVGVRYSLDNPRSYLDANIIGFGNILEACKKFPVNHLIYASSSSVYGMNVKQPFSTDDFTDYPVSLYAATKKSNELMAHTYSHLYQIPSTGLRFFTVYGPFGRPDMAYYKFTKAILNDEPIDVYNEGKMIRDFTYIDDIIEGIYRVLKKPPQEQSRTVTNSTSPHKVLNIGNNNPISLDDFIKSIEEFTGKRALRNHLPMQPGDVPITYADIDILANEYDFQPKTSIEEGMDEFVRWYMKYEYK